MMNLKEKHSERLKYLALKKDVIVECDENHLGAILGTALAVMRMKDVNQRIVKECNIRVRKIHFKTFDAMRKVIENGKDF